MKSLVMLVLLSVGLFGDMMTGNELQSMCKNKAEEMECLHYIVGTVDGINVGHYIEKKSAFFSFPENVTRGQIVAIVKKHMENNPQELHRTASVIILVAVVDAFGKK